MSTLDDRPRSGRPARVTAETRCDVVKLACDKPANHGVEHREVWTYEVLAKVVLQETEVSLSRSEVLPRSLRASSAQASPPQPHQRHLRRYG